MVPLDLIVLSLLVFMFKVKINEKIHAEIVEQLEAKLAAVRSPTRKSRRSRRLKRQREGQDSDRINNQYLPLLPFSLIGGPNFDWGLHWYMHCFIAVQSLSNEQNDRCPGA